MLELFDLWGDLEVRSRFELGVVIPKSETGQYTNTRNTLPKRTDCTQTIHNKSGLKSLSRSILGVDLPKENANFDSDWNAVPLSESQIVYAARDAWAGAAIAKKLEEYDPAIFGLDALIELFKQTETPIAQLAHRRRRRREAKKDLESLLRQYSDVANQPLRLPKQVQNRAKDLRRIINARIIDYHFVFEMHSGLDDVNRHEGENDFF
jgi:hypothetical protein